MNSPIGRWQLEIRTPIGKQTPIVEFANSEDILTGSAVVGGDTPSELRNLTWEPPTLTWDQSVVRPMRLELKFEVTIDGDHLNGHAKAGRLPRSTVTGQRIPRASK
jgi:hypothetical protein